MIIYTRKKLSKKYFSLVNCKYKFINNYKPAFGLKVASAYNNLIWATFSALLLATLLVIWHPQNSVTSFAYYTVYC